MKRLTRRGKIWASVVVVIGGVLYYVIIDRGHARTSARGWFLHHSFRHFACPTCTGRVEELKYNGKHVAVPEIPELPEDSSPKERMIVMSTPVGEFHMWDRAIGWHLRHPSTRTRELPGAILPDELARGYYELETTSWGPERKRDTPNDWCHVGPLMEGRGYWLSPELLGQVRWSGGQLLLAGTIGD